MIELIVITNQSTGSKDPFSGKKTKSAASF